MEPKVEIFYRALLHLNRKMHPEAAFRIWGVAGNVSVLEGVLDSIEIPCRLRVEAWVCATESSITPGTYT